MKINEGIATSGGPSRCQVLLENEISISIRLLSRWKCKVSQHFLVDYYADFGIQKTHGSNISR